MAPHDIRHLGPGDAGHLAGMMTMFGEAFEETETYTAARPGPDHVRRLLSDRCFIALAAIMDDAVVGGLAAYELVKFERERSEIHIYDLAVARSHRRKGLASALISRLRTIAADRGAHVIFVQADRAAVPPSRSTGDSASGRTFCTSPFRCTERKRKGPAKPAPSNFVAEA
jgi:aminoglycoside 3-N-acetyltransferase I